MATDDDRLVSAIIDMPNELSGFRKEMSGELKELNGRVGELNGAVHELNKRVSKLEEQQMKTNLLVAENTNAVMKLADKIEEIPHLVERVTKLEIAVFKKAG